MYPLSLLYGLGVCVDRKITTSFRLSRPVISVGNVTWGGTGKTPAVIKLARYLAGQGVKPAILTRGYGRKSGGRSLVVSDGRSILSTVEECGDEPYLLAQSVPGAAVIVGADRYKAASLAFQELSASVFILDDGFQHWRLVRDADIVCINAINAFGNGCLIPAGILREPLSSLRRARLVLLNHADLVPADALAALEEKIRLHTNAPLVPCAYRVAGLTRIIDNASFDAGSMNKGPVLALSALAENKGFARTLERHGFTVAGHAQFRDHHWYDKTDLETVLASVHCAHPVVTTAKDAVRLKAILHKLPAGDAERFYALNVELVCLQGDSAWEKLVNDTVRSS